MAQIISCSIDVTKIDKTKLVAGKDGVKKYLNLTVNVNDEPDQYGKDCSIALSQSKEEREAKAKRTFLGSGKTIWRSTTKRTFLGSGKTIWRSTTKHTTVKPQANEQGSSEELPF